MKLGRKAPVEDQVTRVARELQELLRSDRAALSVVQVETGQGCLFQLIDHPAGGKLLLIQLLADYRAALVRVDVENALRDGTLAADEGGV